MTEHDNLLRAVRFERPVIIPMVFHTACWRGYVATWEIRDGQFSLVSIRGK
jgi:hypothetical protein